MSKKVQKDIEKALPENERIELWLSNNWKKCLLVVIAVIVAAMAVFAVIYYRKETARKNSEALSAAKGEALAAQLNKTPDADGADLARIRLAGELVEKKSFDKAIVQFKAVAASKTAPVELRVRARLSIAACLEQSGKVQEAADACKVIFNDMSVPQSVRNEAGFNAGRILLDLNQKSEAVSLLQKVVKVLPAANGKNAEPDQWQIQAAILLNRI